LIDLDVDEIASCRFGGAFFVEVEKNAAPTSGIDPQWRRKGNFHFPFGVKPVWNMVVPGPKNAARNKKMHGITGI
jgi:hypothetical protein